MDIYYCFSLKLVNQIFIKQQFVSKMRELIELKGNGNRQTFDKANNCLTHPQYVTDICFISVVHSSSSWTDPKVYGINSVRFILN